MALMETGAGPSTGAVPLPMLATPGPPPTGPGWAYELKWDGVRALLDLSGGRLRVFSRLGNEVTAAYPELAGLGGQLEDALLDGEVVVLDGSGRPSFAVLQRRMHVRDAAQAARLAAQLPVTALVFDVLRLYGVDLTDRPYSERRATLERLALSGPHWTVPPAFDDGPATLQASAEQGLEGVVAKRLDSPYRPGTRSRAWVKVKRVRSQEFVVGGYERGEGARAATLGSLLLGVYADAAGKPLRYVGRVGSGLTGRALTELVGRLAPLRRASSPFDGPTETGTAWWVEPRLVVQVRFSEWTPDGRLRHPVYEGLRTDKNPVEVVREP